MSSMIFMYNYVDFYREIYLGLKKHFGIIKHML